MTLAEIIELRRHQQDDDSNSKDRFFGGYAKGWQDAYSDLKSVLETYGFDMNVEVTDHA